MIELIEHGANVNYVSEPEKRNQTPLFRARNYQAVKLLLQKGADPNMYSTTGQNGEFVKKNVKRQPEYKDLILIQVNGN